MPYSKPRMDRSNILILTWIYIAVIGYVGTILNGWLPNYYHWISSVVTIAMLIPVTVVYILVAKRDDKDKQRL